MKEIGEMIFNMDRVRKSGKMAPSMTGSMLILSNMGMGSISGKMGRSIRVIGLIMK